MERRRRRPPVSCSLCRKRKVRCSRETPCSNCVRTKNATCLYEQLSPPPPRQRRHQGQSLAHGQGADPRAPHELVSIASASSTGRSSAVGSQSSVLPAASSISASTPVSQTSSRDAELVSMRDRIKELEEKLANATLKPTNVSTPATQCNNETVVYMDRTFHFHSENRLLGHSHVFSRSIMHKGRLFGQSHWLNGTVLLREVMELISPHLQDNSSKALYNLQRCKSLAKAIKSQREPPWPTPPTSDLPPKDVADKLVDCYLQSIESVFRILHVPAFKRDYEALWSAEARRDTAFLVQLKLVLAIGATTYDETFSLRSSAIRWVYEAHTWCSEPEFKSRLSIQTLQTDILLLLARETAAVGGTLIWISAGALLRTAIYMGLHRDPSYLPGTSIFAAEMRRRLWNTILEITLQSSMSEGAPPLISLGDFDTEPPSNLDDDELTVQDPVARREHDFTQTTIAIALRKTFPVRLAINKFLNDLNPQGAYEETLRLDRAMRESYKDVCRTLQSCKSSTGKSPSQLDACMVDFIIRRYIAALHIPYYAVALQETAYAFSRKVTVESLLGVWYVSYPSSAMLATQPRTDTGEPGQDILERLTICGSGFFKTVPIQAAFIIAAELKTQLQEDQSLGPSLLRPDLLSALADFKTWCLRCISAGEPNMKGYLVMNLVTAYIDGLRRGLEREDLAKSIVRAAEEAGEKCVPLLEDMARQSQADGVAEALDYMDPNYSPKLMEDWDLMMSDTHFMFENGDPLSWILNDDTAQDPAFVK